MKRRSIDRSPTLSNDDGRAILEHSRSTLRSAALDIERLRGRRNTVAARDLAWCRSGATDWTLVDAFAADGGHYVVARLADTPSSLAALFTPRELEVVTRLVSGLSAKEVAHELGLSPSTVRVLVFRAKKKLGVRRQRELVAKCRPAPLHTLDERSGSKGRCSRTLATDTASVPVNRGARPRRRARARFRSIGRA